VVLSHAAVCSGGQLVQLSAAALVLTAVPPPAAVVPVNAGIEGYLFAQFVGLLVLSMWDTRYLIGLSALRLEHFSQTLLRLARSCSPPATSQLRLIHSSKSAAASGALQW